MVTELIHADKQMDGRADMTKQIALLEALGTRLIT